jgi:hypothetical protein
MSHRCLAIDHSYNHSFEVFGISITLLSLESILEELLSFGGSHAAFLKIQFSVSALRFVYLRPGP